jgi:hypothetical protein
MGRNRVQQIASGPQLVTAIRKTNPHGSIVHRTVPVTVTPKQKCSSPIPKTPHKKRWHCNQSYPTHHGDYEGISMDQPDMEQPGHQKVSHISPSQHHLTVPARPSTTMLKSGSSNNPNGSIPFYHGRSPLECVQNAKLNLAHGNALSASPPPHCVANAVPMCTGITLIIGCGTGVGVSISLLGYFTLDSKYILAMMVNHAHILLTANLSALLSHSPFLFPPQRTWRK